MKDAQTLARPDLFEPFLEDNTPAMKFLPPLYVEGAKQITHKEIEQPFYSTTYFTDRLLGFLREREGVKEGEEKPFFAYLPYTAPHCEYSRSNKGEQEDN